MTPSEREIKLNLKPFLSTTEVSGDSGVWLTLGLDNPQWSSYDKFTLRASWPASHPCDVYLKISDPLHVPSQLLRNRPLHSTRTKYAQVYAVNTGVPTPSSTGEDMTWLRLEPIPLTLVLEPLLFGVLPQSIVPVLLVMVSTIGIALVLLPYVLQYYENLLKDIRQRNTHTKQE